MNNENSTPLPDSFDKLQNLQVEVERLTHLLGIVTNQIPSPEPVDPAIPTLSVRTLGPKIESKFVEEVKSKVEYLEQQIKQMTETHMRVFTFQIYIYTQISSIFPSSECQILKNTMGMVVHGLTFTCTE